jgi:hypothetical protein
VDHKRSLSRLSRFEASIDINSPDHLQGAECACRFEILHVISSHHGVAQVTGQLDGALHQHFLALWAIIPVGDPEGLITQLLTSFADGGNRKTTCGEIAPAQASCQFMLTGIQGHAPSTVVFSPCVKTPLTFTIARRSLAQLDCLHLRLRYEHLRKRSMTVKMVMTILRS